MVAYRSINFRMLTDFELNSFTLSDVGNIIKIMIDMQYLSSPGQYLGKFGSTLFANYRYAEIRRRFRPTDTDYCY